MEDRDMRALNVSFVVCALASITGCGGGDDDSGRAPLGAVGGNGGQIQQDGGWGAIGGGGGTGGAPATGGAAGTPGGGGSAPQCLEVTAPCNSSDECCGDLSCDTTTLGKVCCGNAGATCTTANGEDCCGALLCVSGSCVDPDQKPSFQAPFPCGQSWTYSHHSAEVRRALDFINNSGATNNAPVLASAAGTATQHWEAGGAGNYIVVTHGGGWKTYYFHLQSFSVADGTQVSQGQEVGRVGSTGASSGPHLHYEQLLDGVGKDIVLDGVGLAPYPGSYGSKSATSQNCP
jgi:hypothetical protein